MGLLNNLRASFAAESEIKALEIRREAESARDQANYSLEAGLVGVLAATVFKNRGKDILFEMAVKREISDAIIDGLKRRLPDHAALIDDVRAITEKYYRDDPEWLQKMRAYTDYEFEKIGQKAYRNKESERSID